MSEDEQAILWAAYEGHAGLWDAVWELNALHPNRDNRDRARQIVQKFLSEGLIALFDEPIPEGELQALTPAQAQDRLENKMMWDAPESFEQPVVRFYATDAGEQHILTESRSDRSRQA